MPATHDNDHALPAPCCLAAALLRKKPKESGRGDGIRRLHSCDRIIQNQSAAYSAIAGPDMVHLTKVYMYI